MGRLRGADVLRRRVRLVGASYGGQVGRRFDAAAGTRTVVVGSVEIDVEIDGHREESTTLRRPAVLFAEAVSQSHVGLLRVRPTQT